jgi:hypothetical protein
MLVRFVFEWEEEEGGKRIGVWEEVSGIGGAYEMQHLW